MSVENTGAGPDIRSGVVTEITGRDTLTVAVDGEPVAMRLHGINDGGVPIPSADDEATAFLASIAPVGGAVTFKTISLPDESGPVQAVVMDPGGASLASRMVLAGHANFTPYLRPNRRA